MSTIKRKKKRASDLVASSQVLQILMQDGKSELSAQFQRWKIWYRWPEVVGESISAHCEPVWYMRGTLHIWVRTSSWLQQLIFMSDDIRYKVNRVAGDQWAKKIRFTTDRRAVPKFSEAPEPMKKVLRD